MFSFLCAVPTSRPGTFGNEATTSSGDDESMPVGMYNVHACQAAKGEQEQYL